MGLLAAAVTLGAPLPAESQECPLHTISGSVAPGDGSTPVSAGVVLCNTLQQPNQCSNVSWGAYTSEPFGINFAVSAEFYAMAAGYFWSPPTAGWTCTVDPEPPYCTQCGGGFSIALYADSGGVDGTLSVVPTPNSGLAGFAIWLSGHPASAVTDSSGYFDFRTQSEPSHSNNWGVYVGATGNPGPASGPVSRTYRIGIGAEAHGSLTVTSSALSSAHLTLKNPQAEDPEMRRCEGNGKGPSTATGKPVNVVTGNVFFDQTDAVVPGVRGLTFTRSYNSKNAFRNRGSAFGRGWSHSFDASVSPFQAQSIALRDGEGVPMYFEDSMGNGTYRAVLPASETSWIVQLSGGGYEHHYRSGGSETFDASGRLTSLVDAVGNVTVLERDSSGRLTTITDPGGRALTLGYDSSSRINSLGGPAGLVASYGYDEAGFLESVTYADGSGFIFAYDPVGQVTSVEDHSGRAVERHSYVAGGYALTSERADGREKLTFEYDTLNGKTTVTDALGNVRVYSWKSVAGLRSVTRIEGPCPDCGSAAGDLGQWEYDTKGRVVSSKQGDDPPATYGYDPETGDLLSATDPRGNITEYTYYPDGKLKTRSDPTTPTRALTTWTYVPAGMETVTDPLSHQTSFEYYANGKLSKTIDSRGKTTSFGYTSAGDLQSVTDPNAKTTTFGYDAQERRRTVTDPLGHTTTSLEDVRGHTLRITNHDQTYSEFTYDKGGRRTSVQDPMGRATRYTYDPYGLLETVVDPLNGLTRYGYDLMGNLTSLTDARGQTTTFAYSGNRVQAVQYPGGGQESFTYDPAGRLRTHVDRRGVTTTYEYLAGGALKTKSYSGGSPPVLDPSVAYAYDEVGRLISAANGTDALTWTHDLAGHLLSEHSTKNGSTVAYTYDAGGNRESVSVDGTPFVAYGYDDASRLTTITGGEGVYGFGYDDANRRTSMSYPSGITTSYSYDALNRLTRLKADLGDTPITDFQYLYDNSGNRTRKQQLDYTEDYSYDSLYRLTGVERSGGLTGIWHYGYDPVGNRTTNQVNDSVLTSAFNEKNQLASSSGGGTLRVRGTLNEPGTAKVNGNPAHMLAGNVFEATIQATTGTNTFTVEATDQSGNVTTKSYQVSVRATGATYIYDANGNVAQKVDGADTWTYEWNVENQLVRVTKNGRQVARFAYDALGRRVERTVGETVGPSSRAPNDFPDVRSYLYDGEGILRERNSGYPEVVANLYVNGPGIDEPLAVEPEWGPFPTYYHADGLGSIVKTTNMTGEAGATRQYDSWGNLEAGTYQPGYAFTGREWDPESGLYYYRARYYDPSIGRFINEDPIRYAGGQANFYAYVADNPVKFVDPTGLRTCVRWHQGGRITCVDDPSLCLTMGWCEALPKCGGRGFSSCWQDCWGWYNPWWFGVASSASTVHAATSLPGAPATGGASLGAGIYSPGAVGTCALHCTLDPNGPTHP